MMYKLHVRICCVRSKSCGLPDASFQPKESKIQSSSISSDSHALSGKVGCSPIHYDINVGLLGLSINMIQMIYRQIFDRHRFTVHASTSFGSWFTPIQKLYITQPTYLEHAPIRTSIQRLKQFQTSTSLLQQQQCCTQMFNVHSLFRNQSFPLSTSLLLYFARKKITFSS